METTNTSSVQENTIYPKVKSPRAPRVTTGVVDPIQLIQSFLIRENAGTTFSTEPQNSLEPVLALLRARIEAKRAKKETYTPEAVASYLVSEVMSDDLNSGLAALDIYLSEFPKLKNSEWEMIIDSYRARHSKIEAVYQERMNQVQLQPSTIIEAPTLINQREINTLLFIHLGIRVDLSKGEITRVYLHDKTKAILEALRGEILEKSEFFTRVWGLKTFSIIKHDTVIRTALKRAREQAGIAIRSRDLRVELDPSVLVIT
jgi:hypothetical protein